MNIFQKEKKEAEIDSVLQGVLVIAFISFFIIMSCLFGNFNHNAPTSIYLGFFSAAGLTAIFRGFIPEE